MRGETVPDFTSLSLLTRMKAKSPDAWSQFSENYALAIRKWLSGQGAAGADIDDVSQDVLAFVSGNIAKFEHNGRAGAFRNWLRLITANRLREHWRKQKRHRAHVDLGELAEQLAAENSEVSRVWRQEHDKFMVNHLLAQVSENFQPKSISAFRELVLKQRPAKEVADELGMSVGAARVAQSRVLAALRELGEGIMDD